MTSVLLVLTDSSTRIKSRYTRHALDFAIQKNISVNVCHFESQDLEQLLHQHDVVVFVPRDTDLMKSTIVEFVSVLESDANISAVYADDVRFELPDFSPQRFLCQNYIQGPVAIRASVLSNEAESVSGLIPVVFVYKTLLELDRSGNVISHIPQALSRQRGEGLLELSEREISESRQLLAQEREIRGGGVVGDYLGQSVFASRGRVQGTPLVSIVIPTRALFSKENGSSHSLVINAVESIVEKTDYPNYELVVVVDSGADPQVIDGLKALGGEKLRLVEWTKPFNFSQKMNFGVLHAQGEFVLLLNDDVEVLTNNWLSSMLALAQLPNAGMVGAMLYYEDDSVQHAGHAYFQGSPTHIGLGQPRGARGPLSGYLVQREAPGVTAACALMPVAVFKEVGGFTALLPGNFNDVDLCLKVGWKGFDIYWTPDAELYHFESKTRDAHVHYYELDVIEHRWGLRLSDSRYWRGHPWAAR